MSTKTLKDVLDDGDPASFFNAAKEAGLGSLLGGGGNTRIVRETVAVASNAAVTTYSVDRVLDCVTTTSSTPTRRNGVYNGKTLATGEVKGVDSSAVATKALSFYASDVADGSTADVTYLTKDPPVKADGSTATPIASAKTGIY